MCYLTLAQKCKSIQVNCETKRLIDLQRCNSIFEAYVQVWPQAIRQCFFVTVRAGTAYRHLFQVMKNRNYYFTLTRRNILTPSKHACRPVRYFAITNHISTLKSGIRVRRERGQTLEFILN